MTYYVSSGTLNCTHSLTIEMVLLLMCILLQLLLLLLTLWLLVLQTIMTVTTVPAHYCMSVQNLTGLMCGHEFCRDCWCQYLTVKIMDEGMGQVRHFILTICLIRIVYCVVIYSMPQRCYGKAVHRSICPSHAGIVSKRGNAEGCGLHLRVAQCL